jgi:Delta7-sterol 5-desaturase
MRIFHRHDHKTVTPTPFAAAPEALVQAVFMPLWLLLVPTHALVIDVFLLVMIIRNVLGHAGHELNPRDMAEHPLCGQISTTSAS